MSNFVNPEEVNVFVQNIRPYEVADVGSKKWLEGHEMIIKLSLQAVLEAREHREEEVKELLVLHNKLNILIHEAFCVLLWKTRVLPLLLELDPNPHATFLIYTVFYHEGALISLLDTSLFHPSACEAIGDSALDLIDYCCQGLAQLIGIHNLNCMAVDDDGKDPDETVLSELERQKREIIYKIGLRCISILNYLSGNMHSLPLSCSRRMLNIHDVPWLLVEILQFRPWQRQTNKGLERFLDEQWKVIEPASIPKITKYEAQAWFCLRELLFNTEQMKTYELSQDRRSHLHRAQGLLNETILDQLPLLFELKQFLCQLILQPAQNNSQPNLILEEIPEIHDQLMMGVENFGGFFAIAKKQEETFLTKDKVKIIELAQNINSAYNTDLLAEMECASGENANDIKTESEKICRKCSQAAEKKCGNCSNVYYCCRKCQLDDWTDHKNACVKI